MRRSLPSAGPVIQSAVNISEGRRIDVIEALTAAMSEAIVADRSWDFDHNRMVITLLDAPEKIRHAVLAGARVAVERIDLRSHLGTHPRIGAVDVIPLVPIREASMADCILLSTQIGDDLARELKLPVFLYANSARSGRRADLPAIRNMGFGGLSSERLVGERAPDFGPAHLHPTAGAAIVGAREPLVAHNVNLDSADAAIARRIARQIRRDRETNPQLAGVRALGMSLPSRNIAQVSMNLTRPAVTPLPAVFDYVRHQAEAYGVKVRDSEVIGLIPRQCLGGEQPDRVFCRQLRETQILEHWLETEPDTARH